jgi:translation initiation factor eIF-2B subunit delta
MFSHLKPYLRTPAPARPRRFATRGAVIHPAFARIGLMFSQGTLTGGNARCVALLQACQDAINDYVVPPSQDFCRAFLEHLNQMISFIVTCRPMSISMGNAIRYLKRIIATPGARRLGEDDVRVYLCTMIDEFIDKRIKSADELIMRNLLGLEPHTTPKIVDGDVVLTHGRSHVVEEALKYAHSLNTRFRVVVVDSRPRMEGRGLLKSLAEHGIQCTYVLLSAVSYVMKDVTKVILGAAAMMANGTALSRVGTAVVAMMAHTQRRPVIFCCETYKFSERVQMDGIVSNEVADPADLIKDKDGRPTLLEGWEEVDHMGVLNLSYDLTPQEFITVIVTDVGNIPTTSVPVIIREFIAEGVLDDQ